MLSVLVSEQVEGRSRTDSLLSVFAIGNADGSTYNELIWAYVFNKPDSAIYFGQRGLEWVQRTGHDSLLASMQNRIGVAYDIRSMPDSALYWYGRALPQARRLNNRKTEAGVLNNIGLIYWNKGATDKAIEYYIQAAEIFEQLGDLIGLGNAYNNIGLILHDDQDYDKCLRYFRKALEIRKKANDRYGLGASYANLAMAFHSMTPPQPDSVAYYLNLAIPIKISVNDRYGLARAYATMADLHMNRGAIDEALNYLSECLELQKQLDNAEGYASTYYNMTMMYSKMGNVSTALAYLDSAEQIADQQQDLDLLWKVYYAKAKGLGKLNRFEESFPYWLAYDQLKDSLVNVTRSAKVEELETRYRTAQQEKQLVETRLKAENRMKWLFALSFLVLFVLVLSFALIQLNKSRAQAEKDAAIIAERERGLQAMIEATEKERQRIAKDLHDGIVQSLTALSLRLQHACDPGRDSTPEPLSVAQESKTMLNDAIAELRGISHQMMPRVLGEMGLIPALDDMLAKAFGNTEIVYQFEHHRVDGKRYPEQLEVGLFRICQELVNNIIKHAQATMISVQCFETAGHLVIVVEDNGIGIERDRTGPEHGIGLTNIETRVRAMSGEVHFERGPEQGTVVTVRIPLP